MERTLNGIERFYLGSPPPVPCVHLVVDPLRVLFIGPLLLRSNNKISREGRIRVKLLYTLQRISIDDLEFLGLARECKLKREPLRSRGQIVVDNLIEATCIPK